jgi:hypothetical protein
MLKSCLLGVKTGAEEERAAVMGRQVPGRKQLKNKEAATESRNPFTQPVTGHGNIQKHFWFVQFVCFSFVSFCLKDVRSDVPVIPSSLFFDPHSAA